MQFRKVGLALVALTATVSLAACTVEEPATGQDAKAAKVEKKGKKKGKEHKAAEPSETLAQENARASAESYLDMSGFSREGLIKQLKFEDYSKADAAYAVDHLDVNWNKEAGESAESYMDTTSFSRGELLNQLKFEGFTAAQAAHGLKAVGY